jgi:hypothetical protein
MLAFIKVYYVIYRIYIAYISGCEKWKKVKSEIWEEIQRHYSRILLLDNFAKKAFWILFLKK